MASLKYYNKTTNQWEYVNFGSESGSGDILIDNTLTQTGQAADAKAVGEALAEKQPKGNYLTSIPSEIEEKLDYTNIAYGTCSTAADTAEKSVVLSGNTNWSLKIGSIIMVKFDISNSAENVKINVNNTGAYPIWYNADEYTGTGTAYTGYANRTIAYMFNGTHYVWITASYDTNSTDTNASLGQGYATCSTAAATTAKVGTLSSYKLVTGGIVSVKFTNSVPASATLNINSTGAKNIYFRGAKITTDIIKAGDVATFVYSSRYQLISIDRWQNDITSLQTALSDKLESSELPTAINTALAQAKASGEFDGRTPVKGTDYWTDTDKQEIIAELKESDNYTNCLLTAVDIRDTSKVLTGEDGSIGYLNGYYYKAENNSFISSPDCDVSGGIPTKAGDIIRLRHVTMYPVEANPGARGVTFFDASGTYLNGASLLTGGTIASSAILDSDGNIIEFLIPNWAPSDMAYMTITCQDINEKSIITVNEKIPEDSTEVRITNIETELVNLDTRVTTLESAGGTTTANGIPDYVITEAESVIDRVVAAQGNRTFTFAAITDMHYGNSNYTDGIKHACQALKYIDSRIKLDAIAVLGDYTDGYPSTGIANAMADFKNINALLDNLRFAPNLRLQGNHD